MSESKISKVLSEETRKELKCDTIKEFHRDSKVGYVKHSVKVTLSEDNSTDPLIQMSLSGINLFNFLIAITLVEQYIPTKLIIKRDFNG